MPTYPRRGVKEPQRYRSGDIWDECWGNDLDLMIFNAITAALDGVGDVDHSPDLRGNTKNGPYECREALNKSSLSALLLKSADRLIIGHAPQAVVGLRDQGTQSQGAQRVARGGRIAGIGSGSARGRISCCRMPSCSGYEAASSKLTSTLNIS
jgi:hypothetical protein